MHVILSIEHSSIPVFKRKGMKKKFSRWKSRDVRYRLQTSPTLLSDPTASLYLYYQSPNEDPSTPSLYYNNCSMYLIKASLNWIDINDFLFDFVMKRPRTIYDDFSFFSVSTVEFEVFRFFITQWVERRRWQKINYQVWVVRN